MTMLHSTPEDLEDCKDVRIDDIMSNLGQKLEVKRSSYKPARSSSYDGGTPNNRIPGLNGRNPLRSQSEHDVSSMSLSQDDGNQSLRSFASVDTEISVGKLLVSPTTRKLNPNAVRPWNGRNLLGLPPAFRSPARNGKPTRSLSLQEIVLRESRKPLSLDSNSSHTPTTGGSTCVDTGSSIGDMPSPTSTGKLNKNILSLWNEGSGTGLPPAFRASLKVKPSQRPVVVAPAVVVPPLVPPVLGETQAAKATSKNKQGPLSPPAKLARAWPPKKKPRAAKRERIAEKTTPLSVQHVKKQVESLDHQSRIVSTVGVVKPTSGDTDKDILHNEGNDTAPSKGASLPPKSALKGETREDSARRKGVKRKASLKIRWKGAEIIYIESRHDSYYDDLYYADDLVVDHRFQSSEASVGVMGGPLLPDRFASRNSDFAPCCPNRPRRGSMSSQESCDDGSSSDEDRTARDGTPALPTVWITVCDESDPTNGIQWRAKRVWNDDVLDAQEVERIVSESELMDTVKTLAGVYGLDNTARESRDHYDSCMRQWSVKRVYDMDGTIQATESEQTMDEVAMRTQMQALSESSEMMESTESCHDQLLPSQLVTTDSDTTRNVTDESTPAFDAHPRALEGLASPAEEGSTSDSDALKNATTETSTARSTKLQADSSTPEVEQPPKQDSAEISSIPTDSPPTGNTKAKKAKKKAKKHPATLADLLSPPKSTRFL